MRDDITRYVKDDSSEDGSVNALGQIPSGPLHKPKKKDKDLVPLADRVIQKTEDASIYDAKLHVEKGLDINKLPEIKNAIAQALGSEASVKFDEKTGCFYVDGNPEAVEKVKQVLTKAGVEVSEQPIENLSMEIAASGDEEELGDEEILQPGRLADLMIRIITKIERKPMSQRAEHYKVLMLDVMRAVEDKPAAMTAMFKAAREYLKTQF